MGNPILDRDSVVDYIRLFYDWGLIDSQGALAVKPIQNEFDQAVKDGNNLEANEVFSFCTISIHYTYLNTVCMYIYLGLD